ncbi:hypothetical protein [Thalassovita sp.]|uniref:hypothetical protein n=1 Tax=Thalassovita sp. TaxID=1979401 RepID=UPI002B26FD1A|nr:hypothetical protein [Thalassovita sp.]
MMEAPAWRALSPNAQALYPWIRMEWKGAQYNNNGKIRLSVRQAAGRMGVSVNTAAKAFRELQAKGFIVVSDPGALGVEGLARGPSYELTEIKMPMSESNQGRKLYEQWRSGCDFEVFKHNVNNPKGMNGRRASPSQNAGRSHLKPCDVSSEPVAVPETSRHETCDVSRENSNGSVTEIETSLVTIRKGTIPPPELRKPIGAELCALTRGRVH